MHFNSIFFYNIARYIIPISGSLQNVNMIFFSINKILPSEIAGQYLEYES